LPENLQGASGVDPVMLARRGGLSLVVLAGTALAWPEAARAQSFFLLQGKLKAQGKTFGTVRRLPVTVEWRNPEYPLVTFDGRSVRVRGQIPVGSHEGALLAGVGGKVSLTGCEGWAITMAKGTWAPVLRGSPRSTEIVLPRGFPVRQAGITAGAPGAVSQPHDYALSWWDLGTIDWHPARTKEQAQFDALILEDTEVFRWIGDPKPWLNQGAHKVTGIAAAVVPGSRWVKMVFSHGGFEVVGFVRARPKPKQQKEARKDTGSLRGVGVTVPGSFCSDGAVGPGRQVWLEPGTGLFEDEQNRNCEPAIVVKKQIEASETSMPALPLDPDAVPKARFFLWIDSASMRLELSGFLAIPNRALEDVDASNKFDERGYGYCDSVFPTEWPPEDY
jgi:hypothetical protein